MSVTLSDLFTPLSKDDVLASILEIAADLGLPVTAWQPGQPSREILEVTAQKIADFTNTTTVMAAGGLLDFAVSLADPGWITLLAKSVYGVDRILATFGTTTEHLTNASVVTYTINAGDLHFLNSVSGKTYINTTGGTLVPSGTLDITIVADESGSASNANPGDINALVNPLAGVTVTNTLALVASDDETPLALAQRCRDKLAAASPNGPRDAYRFFATSAVRADGSGNVGVTRVQIVQSNGSLTVYVATNSGAVPGTMTNPATDLGAVHLNIQSNCVPTGITETTTSAITHNIHVVGDVYLRHGSTLSSAATQNLVLTKLVNYFATIPIGGFDIGGGGRVFLDAIIGQMFQASPDIVQATLTLPAADVVMGTGEVAVLTSIAADFTIHAT